MNITIIIPLTNTDYLDRALSSIASQKTDAIIDVLLINDGQTADCNLFISKYSKYFDIEEIILKKNRGPAIARNIGLTNAKGDYVYFLDDDDKFYNENSLNALYINIGNADFISGMYLEYSKKRNVETFLQGKLFKKSFLTKNHIKFPNMRINEPVTFCLDCAFLSDNYKKIDDIICVYYRNNRSSITRTYADFIKSNKLFIKAFEKSYKKAKRHGRVERANKYCINIFTALAVGYYKRKQKNKFDKKFDKDVEVEYINLARKFYYKHIKYIETGILSETDNKQLLRKFVNLIRQ